MTKTFQPSGRGYAALWWGGESYTLPSEEHWEYFFNLAEAKAEFRNRYFGSGTQRRINLHSGSNRMVESVDVTAEPLRTPAVTMAAYMDLHRFTWTFAIRSSPEYRLTVGPRGGTRVRLLPLTGLRLAPGGEPE